MLGRIRPIGFGQNDGLKMLLYGRSGTGKTTFWGTFPTPTLAIICSGGNKPGELRSLDTPAYRKTIEQVTVQQSDDIRELVDYLGGGSKYKTVVLDHASGLQDLILKEILGLDELPAQKSWGMASQQQYGQCTTKCKEYLRALLNLDTHVVIVSQEKETRNEGESDVISPNVGAALMPSLAGWLNPAVDYICQTLIRQKVRETMTTIAGKQMAVKEKLKDVEYCLRTGPDPVYTTKFRVPRGAALPDVIIDPTFAKVYGIITGEEPDDD